MSGSRHFEKKRADGRQRKSIEFFCKILEADCEKLAVENPINIIAGPYISKYFPDLAEKYHLPKQSTQIIQPYEFGHKARKATCLWLKGLPKLKPTNIVEPDLVHYTGKDGRVYTFSADYGSGDATAGTRRSKTYPGIANAMAEQWSDVEE